MKSFPLAVLGPEIKLIDGDPNVFWLPAVHQLGLILSHFRLTEMDPFHQYRICNLGITLLFQHYCNRQCDNSKEGVSGHWSKAPGCVATALL